MTRRDAGCGGSAASNTAPDRTGEAPERLVFEGAGGLPLAADAWGPRNGPPCVLLHGGGQTRHAWGTTGERLGAAGYRAVALDLRGHGESGWPEDGDYSIDAFADDLRRVVGRLGAPPALVGASLGGLTSLVAVTEAPRLPARALVLVDVGPRIEADGVAEITRFMTAHPDGFASLEEAADAVAAYLPRRPRPRDLSGLARNLRLGPDGRYHWHWDPRFLGGVRGGSPQPPASPAPGTRRILDPARLDRAAASLELPTLLVRGRLSNLLSEAGARHFLALAPHAEYTDISGAGHMVAGDRNDLFGEAVLHFLERLDRGRPQGGTQP